MLFYILISRLGSLTKFAPHVPDREVMISQIYKPVPTPSSGLSEVIFSVLNPIAEPTNANVINKDKKVITPAKTARWNNTVQEHQ
ncbi:hypothetical protein D920_02754 [Enterococcus faecalis 13-SD-W-01]|nr:hypothetical protein D920_02754 [Enterococcus faecalis 13-SD-W-01]